MQSILKVTGLNLDISWKNPDENFRKIEEELEGVQTDLVVLPEMFSTGFYMKPADIADRTGTTLSWMKELAKKHQFAVAGSVSVQEDEKFYNRFYFVKPDADFCHYDKRHLFTYSGEDKRYTPGKSRTVVEYKGWRILLQVCYDLRFPVASRNTGDYDAVLYVANWPDTRVQAWNVLLQARAIENQAYVVGINRIGTDGNHLTYVESSWIFSPEGKDLTQKNSSLISANLNANDLREFRQKFPFLEDRDEFQLL